MTQEATKRWGLVGGFGGVAFEGYVLSVCGGEWRWRVFTSTCAHVCMEVRGWCLVFHSLSVTCSNFLRIGTFHPGEKFLKTQKVLEGVPYDSGIKELMSLRKSLRPLPM